MLSRLISIRGFLGLLTLASAVVGPLWLTFLLAFCLAVRFRAWEIVTIGAFMDALWLPEAVSLHAFPMNTLVALVLIMALEPLRRELMIRTQVL